MGAVAGPTVSPQPRLSFSPPYNCLEVELPRRGGNHAKDLRETTIITGLPPLNDGVTS